MAELSDDQKLVKVLQDQIKTLTGEKQALTDQVASLSAEKNSLTSEKQALAEENTKLKADCEGLGTQLLKAQDAAAEVGKQLVAANTAKTKAESDLSEAIIVVNDLKIKLATKTDESTPLGSVKVGKDTYELTSDFFYKGAEVTLQSLKENAELAAELVAEKIGNLRKVVKA